MIPVVHFLIMALDCVQSFKKLVEVVTFVLPAPVVLELPSPLLIVQTPACLSPLEVSARYRPAGSQRMQRDSILCALYHRRLVSVTEAIFLADGRLRQAVAPTTRLLCMSHDAVSAPNEQAVI